jgi:hypothetical protein
MDSDYALIATGAGMKALRVRPDAYSELYELKDAEEFTVNFGGAGTTNALSMTTISHADIESWPVAFWLDTVQPGTGAVTCPDCSFCRNLPQGTSGVQCLTPMPHRGPRAVQRQPEHMFRERHWVLR